MRSQRAPQSGNRAASADSRPCAAHRHRGTCRPAFAQPDRHRFAAIIEKTWGLAKEDGTLGSSLVFVNERLPQEVRLFKVLEGYFHRPSRYLNNSAANPIKISDRTHHGTGATRARTTASTVSPASRSAPGAMLHRPLRIMPTESTRKPAKAFNGLKATTERRQGISRL